MGSRCAFTWSGLRKTKSCRLISISMCKTSQCAKALSIQKSDGKKATLKQVWLLSHGNRARWKLTQKVNVLTYPTALSCRLVHLVRAAATLTKLLIESAWPWSMKNIQIRLLTHGITLAAASKMVRLLATFLAQSAPLILSTNFQSKWGKYPETYLRAWQTPLDSIYAHS